MKVKLVILCAVSGVLVFYGAYCLGFEKGREITYCQEYKVTRENLRRSGELDLSKDVKNYLKMRLYYFGKHVPDSWSDDFTDEGKVAESPVLELLSGKDEETHIEEYRRYKLRITEEVSVDGD